MASSTITEGEILAGKYRVEKVLGQGGMGVVVSAFHLELEQRVAVKVLHPELAERGDAAERFRREARAAAKINSEYVARVIDVGVLPEGGAYMVMEYLEGNDFADEVERRGMLPVSEAVEYLVQTCEAVAEAHAVGIVHRDLKPANLFLTQRSDGTRVTKVLDFGISKSVVPGSSSDPSLTGTSTVMGSPLYMSPEQMRSARDVDTRADIWALGVILYEALAGRPPHIGDSVPQICASLLHDPPPPLAEFRNDVPPDLERVLVKCLAKDRADRYATVGELANALASYASPGSILHAQRANRVLGTSREISAPSMAKEGHNAPLHNTPANVPPGAPTLIADPAQTPHEATLNSWDATHSSKRGSHAVPRPPSRIRQAAIAAALLLISAGALGLWLRGSNDGAQGPGSSSQSVAKAVVVTPPPLPVEAPPLPSPTSDPSETAMPSAVGKLAAETVETRPADARSTEPLPGVPRVAPKPSAATAPKHDPSPRQPSKPDGITDFGGRR
ncbi:MAG TPA: serine/threonine-protein kinase [Polyangiaceae bacterium]|nr:serine/threonine-protein kinase [Polyangiaceae bacterium]